MRRALAIALVLAAGACGSGAAPPASSAPLATTAPATSTPPPATAAPLPSATAPVQHVVTGTRRASTPEERASRQQAITEARASVRAERWADALASFERALAIDPGDARLRCETGYAAYRAGRVELADTYIADAQRALPDPAATPDAMRVPVAMCLYNAGLVHEARGRRDDARAAYAASIALRPNDTVQQHLDALGGALQGPAGILSFDGLDDAAIDVRLRQTDCEDADPSHCTPGPHVLEDDDYVLTQRAGDPATDAPATPPFAAHVVWFGRSSDSEGNQGVLSDHGWLVVREGTHALAALVSAEDATGVWECSAAVTRFAWSDVVPGGAPELVLDATSCSGEVNDCRDLASDSRHVVVCAASPLRCIDVSLQSESRGVEYTECDNGQEGGPQTAYDEGYRLDAELANGALTLRPTFGAAPIPAIVGAHPLTELFDRVDLRWAARPP